METVAKKSGGDAQVSGNLLLLYAFDIGDEIDLNKIRRKKLVPSYVEDPFPHFKNYHIPLSVKVDDLYEPKNRKDSISCRIHSFGVVSFCYKVPLSGQFETLKVKVIDTVQKYKEVADKDARNLFDSIRLSIKDPHFYNLESDYYAVQIDPIKESSAPENFMNLHSVTITSLLRLETKKLSEYQQKSILKTATGYYGKDFIVIDGEAAFVYDAEYFEAIEFFELANIQRLELQRFDQLLDKKLNAFYGENAYRTPLLAYVPLIADRADKLIIDLARLRVDVSVITERLANSIKLVGDVYYEELYSLLSNKFRLQEWKQSIDVKLNIIGDLYGVFRDRHSNVREEILTIVIIILIAVEAMIAFYH
jgi:hypothetical protein